MRLQIACDRKAASVGLRREVLAFGQPGEVAAYCDRLLDAMGTDGGFILGSGCEVPSNARWENVEAMIERGKRRR